MLIDIQRPLFPSEGSVIIIMLQIKILRLKKKPVFYYHCISEIIFCDFTFISQKKAVVLHWSHLTDIALFLYVFLVAEVFNSFVMFSYFHTIFFYFTFVFRFCKFRSKPLRDVNVCFILFNFICSIHFYYFFIFWEFHTCILHLILYPFKLFSLTQH